MSADATPMAADAPRELKKHMGFVPWLELAANHSLLLLSAAIGVASADIGVP